LKNLLGKTNKSGSMKILKSNCEDIYCVVGIETGHIYLEFCEEDPCPYEALTKLGFENLPITITWLKLYDECEDVEFDTTDGNTLVAIGRDGIVKRVFTNNLYSNVKYINL
jgi:hypothetical protein